MNRFTHLDEEGRARMVDVGEKAITQRIAVAAGKVRMKPETLKRILEQRIEKGDVFSVARISGILAAKKTHEIIPLCHPLPLESIEVNFTADTRRSELNIETQVKCSGKTGVEMEALVATATAALTVYDMCKAVDRGMVISEIMLMKKSGGKSGLYVRKDRKINVKK